MSENMCSQHFLMGGREKWSEEYFWVAKEYGRYE